MYVACCIVISPNSDQSKLRRLTKDQLIEQITRRETEYRSLDEDYRRLDKTHDSALHDFQVLKSETQITLCDVDMQIEKSFFSLTR